jgi:DNA-binding IclR family transcriptional regulator
LRATSGKDPSLVKSLDRAIDVVEALAHHPDGVSVTGLAASMNLPKSSVFRVLNTLRTRGYVQQNPASERYSLSFKFLSLARSVAQENDLRNIASPYLKELRNATGETVHLAVPIGHAMVYIDKVESESSVRLSSQIGQLANFHSTALGKAYLSALPLEEREAFVANLTLERCTERTLVTRQDLLDELERCTRQQFAIDNVENEDGVRCVGAAVKVSGGDPVAAISISAPSSRFTKRRATAVGPICARTAGEISSHLRDAALA